MSIYDIISCANEKGNLCALFHTYSTLYWTFEFVPPVIAAIIYLEKLIVPFPTDFSNTLRGESNKMASVAYYQGLSDEEILGLIGHKKILYNELVLNHDEHVTNCIASQDNDGRVWFAFSGLDMRKFTSIAAIGNIYFTDMSQYGLKGKVLSSFIPNVIRNEPLLGSIKEKELYISGHSMGSCMAIIFGAYLAKKWGEEYTVNVYAYAPIIFYDDDFADCVTAIPNLNLHLFAHKEDMVVNWFNLIKVTDKNEYKNFSISERSIPYYMCDSEDGGENRTELELETISWLDVLNPMNYEKHGLWNFRS